MRLSLTASALYRGVLLLVLLFLVMAGAIPHYLKGQWSGSHPLVMSSLKELHHVTEQGLTVPGWETVDRKIIKMGEGQEAWLAQTIRSQDPAAKGQTVTLLLKSPKWSGDRPQLEWTDIRGNRRWQEDEVTSLRLDQTTARWFRGWQKLDNGLIPTIAVLEWYAWPQGGHWSGDVWFWRDWQQRWSRQKTPWLAVAILIPMEPLGELAEVQPQEMALLQAVQSALEPIWGAGKQ